MLNIEWKQIKGYEGLYEVSNDGDIVLEKDDSGVFIDKRRREIYGVDNSKLDLLYDLIKADLVEKVKHERD